MIGSHDPAPREIPAQEEDGGGITWSAQWKAFRSDFEEWGFERQK